MKEYSGYIFGIIGTILGTIFGALTQFFISILSKRQQLTGFNIEENIKPTKEADPYVHNTEECPFEDAQYIETNVTFSLHWQGLQAITIQEFRIYPIINKNRHSSYISEIPRDDIKGECNVFNQSNSFVTIPNGAAVKIDISRKIKKDDKCFGKIDSLEIIAIDISKKSWKLTQKSNNFIQRAFSVAFGGSKGR